MRLNGKSAIITGAASGFGQGIATEFAKQGAQVMVADINYEAAELHAKTINGVSQQVDVSNNESVLNMITSALKQFGKIDILVNNAGITHLKSPLEDVTEEEFDRVIAVNAKSVYLTAKHLVPLMKKEKKGSILNVASTAGISPRANLSWYNASKGWMITATKTMAVELAPFGIRTNAICPVAGETPLLKSFMGKTHQKFVKNF